MHEVHGAGGFQYILASLVARETRMQLSCMAASGQVRAILFLIPCVSRYGYYLILLQKDAGRRGLHAIFDVVFHRICPH
jgi:Ca2+/H+ antiporter